MPFFSRRRLQSMINDISVILTEKKQNELLGRLNDKQAEQALPAEMELALLWLLQKTGPFEVEPDWWPSTDRPDAYSENFLPGKKVVIEITAVGDNSLSYKADMDLAAETISAVANRFKKKIGKRLSYNFHERSGYRDGNYYREVIVPKKYSPSKQSEEKIEEWVKSGLYEHAPLRLQEEGLSVVVKWGNAGRSTFTSKPVEAYSLTENPLYSSLDRKRRQLRAAPPDVLKVIFLADAGSTLLNRMGRLGESDPLNRTVSATDIISHFVSKNIGRIDAVVCFAPQVAMPHGIFGTPKRELVWRVTVFGSAQEETQKALLKALEGQLTHLPRPLFEGYQAKSSHRQGRFNPEKSRWYKGTSMTVSRDAPTEIRFSARAFLDFLAGRIDEEEFRYFLGAEINGKNLFTQQLFAGKTIRSAELSARSLDEDDDQLVLVFDDDPAAGKLVFPKTMD